MYLKVLYKSSNVSKRIAAAQVILPYRNLHRIDRTNSKDNNQSMNMQQHSNLTAYYETFNRETSNGRVFVDDLSATKVEMNKLTTIEKEARIAYHDVVSRLVRAYPMYMKTHPIATTKEEVLQQRVVAPCLKNIDNEVSKRSATNEARAGRLYPRNIHPWTEFQDAVAGYHLDNSTRFDEAINGIFYDSLNRATNLCCDEADEQGKLIENLNQTLKKAGIIHEANKTTPFSGKIDFCIMKDKSTASIICECKSTHNLLLPTTAVECQAAYDAAYVHGERNVDRSPAWANVAHPIGQLLSYMVDNEHCFGALTSGTKTYFIKIQSPNRCITDIGTDSNEQKSDDMFHMTTRSGRAKRQKTIAAEVSPGIHNEKTNMGSKVAQAACNLFCATEVASKRTSQNQKDHTADNDSDHEMDSGVKVYISDAWCVGEENYLRAWAYMHTLHESAEPWIAPIDWIESTTSINRPSQWGQNRKQPPSRMKQGKPPSPSDVRDSGADGHGNSAKRCNLDYYYPIHQGKLDYVPFDDIVFLDVLGNGRNGNCFKVQWNGTECAMKQFDIGRDGHTYFEKEIQAYMLLQKAWGILVPRPLFLSESFSGGRLFLGLQLGRESTSDEDLPKFENVLQLLETEYGIRHCDAVCGRNMIVITDGDGVERVAAIDLEDWIEV